MSKVFFFFFPTDIAALYNGILVRVGTSVNGYGEERVT